MNIAIRNTSGRIANIVMFPVTTGRTTRNMIMYEGQLTEPESCTIIKPPNWANNLTSQEIVKKLIETDPEIDKETTGKPFKNTGTVYTDKTGKIAKNFKEVEIKYTPNGEEKSRKPAKKTEPTTNFPLKVTDKWITTDEATTKFIWHKVYALVHQDSLGYDFMIELAQKLQTTGLVKIGAGPTGTDPLILTRGGLASIGYLRGWTDGKQYKITLHLTVQELKTPPQKQTEQTKNQT